MQHVQNCVNTNGFGWWCAKHCKYCGSWCQVHNFGIRPSLKVTKTTFIWLFSCTKQLRKKYVVRWFQAARCKEYCTASATRADNTSPHSTPKETYWRCAKLCNIKGNKDTQKQGREMGANGYKWLQSKHVWSRHVQHLWHLAAPACRALASIAVLVLQQCPACHVSFIVWKPELPFSKDSILLNIWGKVSWICTCFASAAFAAFQGLQILLCPSNQASTKPEMLHWNVALPNDSKQNKGYGAVSDPQ